MSDLFGWSLVGWTLMGAGSLLVANYSYHYAKKLLLEYVNKKINQKVEELAKQDDEKELIKPFHKNSVVVKFVHQGRESKIYLPYNDNSIGRTLTKRFFLITQKEGENGETVVERHELEQKPGIPFLVSAGDLGGEQIVMEDLEGETLKVFNKWEVPTF